MFPFFLCIAMTCGINDAHDTLEQSFVIWCHDPSYYILNFHFHYQILKKIKRIYMYNELGIVYVL